MQPRAEVVGRTARALLSDTLKLRQRVDGALISTDSMKDEARAAYAALRTQMVQRELEGIPIARLAEVANGRLRLGALEKAGYRTIGRIVGASQYELDLIPGVGQMTAQQVIGAARQVARAVEDGIRVRVDLDPSNGASSRLIVALDRLGDYEAVAAQIRPQAEKLRDDLGRLVPAAAPARGKLRGFLAGRRRRDEAQTALARIQEIVEWASDGGFRQQLERTHHLLDQSPDPADAWKRFELHSTDFYGLLGELVDLGADHLAAQGFLPTDIAERVSAQPLDDTFSRVTLRGYQAFGARFSLAQRRVIIGDEMGLGKTIQAIAAVAHLKSQGSTHFLVACPASVLVNWTREITSRSTLRAYRVHGVERAQNLAAWRRHGDVAITTLDSLHSLGIPSDVKVGMFIVDEAHFAKNPTARRSKAVQRWTNHVERVLFLTGTPMENRVEEFHRLVNYLQPTVLKGETAKNAAAGVIAFRQAVAPVYLRRNQEDVLTELPDLIETEEWVEFGKADLAAYRAAVADGNFMAMRRAAFLPGNADESAKLERLIEIVGECRDDGLKVVIFSYFRDVLAIVQSALGQGVHGPLSGDVPPEKRQAMVDRFSTVDGHSVLLAQIQAGGVGLNIQSASVVIICEPQVKPTIEQQAIARCHRMGQVRTVQAHRLLTENSVDQRMLEMLSRKTRLFDDYARRSATAEASPDAVDISEVELARRVVAQEQERLFLKKVEEQAAAE